jgi:late competence protein required for DNA uptake (superfamily II DNA/RNA helicase)
MKKRKIIKWIEADREDIGEILIMHGEAIEALQGAVKVLQEMVVDVRAEMMALADVQRDEIEALRTRLDALRPSTWGGEAQP